MWPSNQYGLLKVIRVTQDGTFLDDRKMSGVTLADIYRQADPFWNIRFEVPEDAEHVGGLSLFGRQFGNHAQDIVMRVFFEKESDE